MKWLHKQPGWVDVTPRELLIRQLEADDSYVIVDLLQSYIGGLVLRKSSKQKAHSVIRSFFAHNRCALPEDPSFRIRGDRPPVDAKLTVDDIVGACHAATIRYQSIILVKWQSFLDNARLFYINTHCANEIVKQIQMGTHPVRIDLAGRKETENDTEGRFNTYIGKDAVDALTRYFDEERGWPHPGEPLWIQTNRKPLQKATMESTWLHLMRHMGKIPKRKGPIGSRYGYNLHEMRYVATTYLVPAEKLVLEKRLSKPPEEYRKLSHQAIAAQQLQKKGRYIHAGQNIRYVVTADKSAITSNRTVPSELFEESSDYDAEAYVELLISSVVNLLLPFRDSPPKRCCNSSLPTARDFRHTLSFVSADWTPCLPETNRSSPAPSHSRGRQAETSK
jgi:hypothetical protein